MFGLKYNPFKSITVGGAVVAIGTYAYSHVNPTGLSPVLQVALQAGGLLLSVLGGRNAIAKGPQ